MPMHLPHRPFTHFLHGIIPSLRMQAGILQKLSNICFFLLRFGGKFAILFLIEKKRGTLCGS